MEHKWTEDGKTFIADDTDGGRISAPLPTLEAACREILRLRALLERCLEIVEEFAPGHDVLIVDVQCKLGYQE